MDRMKNRMVLLVAVIAIVAGLLACGTSGLLGRQEKTTATPTKTPKPTFTATLTPSLTPVPTDTPVRTDTPTPEPPTLTPIIETATFTPVPTDTPSPVPPTATKKPTAKPTSKPKPTATKTPIPAPTATAKPAFEFTGVHPAQYDTPNCGGIGVLGKVYSRTNAGMAGVSVAVWAVGWEGTVSNPSDSTGKWEVSLGSDVKAGQWHARAVNPATCQPKAGGGATPSANCTGWRSDDMVVATTANCTGQGAVQWPVVDFKQN